MKNLKYSIVIILLIILVGCIAKKQPGYVLPDEMSPEVKIEYAKICDKGKVLYDMNCASCHTKMIKGKEVIPDFTAEQLESYSIRVANPTHESRVTEENLSAEELSFILTYLSYKPKNIKN